MASRPQMISSHAGGEIQSCVVTDIVIVTGAASGIGHAVAEMVLARSEEVEVRLIDQNGDGVRDVAAALGDRATGHACDVTDHEAVSVAIASAIGGDRCIGLVNAAGNHRAKPSLELSPDDWHSVLDVHLDGTLYPSQAAARLMISTGGGSIVNFSSVASHFGWPGRLAYSVAKAAIGALTRTLAVEWAEHGIRVNAVAPGYVNTPMIRHAAEQGVIDAEALAAQHAVQRFAEPSEIAEVVEFLLSARASFMTGEVVVVDGGFSVKR
jgi:NAD(P)-dependent dehydrogenase (short-subunit alcohol dehydrogenase family)